MLAFFVVLLCCLALAAVWIALAGPERWHQKVRAQVRPGGPAPTESGYRLLFWRNWLVAVVLIASAVVAVDRLWLSDAELKNAADRALKALDGTTDEVTADRIESEIELAVDKDLTVRQLDRDDDADSTDGYPYEIVKDDSADEEAPAAVCVEVQRVGDGTDAVDRISYITVNTGPCD